MAKHNTARKQHTPAPVTGPAVPAGVTYEGAPGYARDPKGELFLLAVTNMGGEQTFYEAADERDARFAELVRQVAVTDPEWIAGFAPWLRNVAQMRTASVVLAAEAAKAMLDADIPGSRKLIARTLARADEPGELAAYWVKTYGRALPMPVKRGLADACDRLYTEFSLLRYDTGTHPWRFGDVIELCHARGDGNGPQGDLYRYAIDRRHSRAGREIPASLVMVRAQAELRRVVAEGATGGLADTDRLRAAGLTWEDALSLAGGRVDAAALWEALIPSMGYMALLRNLANFDRAQIGVDAVARVAARLTDPEQVAKSRQFPLRFLAAYRAAAPSWHPALGTALGLSLANVPELAGRTLVLVDRSGSMFWDKLSARSSLTRADGAAIFGAALAMRCQRADLVEFGSGYQRVEFSRDEPLLGVADRFSDMGGTQTAQAVRGSYAGHDRVVILTDEQAWAGPRGAEPTRAVPAEVPVYTWNLAGYKHGHGPAVPGRYTFGGLTDAAFGLIPLLEAGPPAVGAAEAV